MNYFSKIYLNYLHLTHVMNHRKVGIGIVIFTLILASIFLAYTMSIEKYITSQITIGPKGECIHPEGTQCPYETLNQLQPYNHVLIAILLLLFFAGSYLIFIQPKKEILQAKTEKVESSKVFQKPKNLNKEEKIVYNLILENQGSIFQSDIVKKTEWSKVRVTRFLDKLEGKGIIERRRRGMTNVVILK